MSLAFRPAHLLVVNPNTTAAVTSALAARARAMAPPDAVVTAVTARFGAPYITDELSYAVATHAFVDALHAAHQAGCRPDAVLLGCFGDPGLPAGRQVMPVPVVGMAEAAMRAAAEGGPFGIVTGGLQWPPMLRRLAGTLGLADALVDVVAVAPSGAALAADPEAAHRLLLDACRQCRRAGAVQRIVVGGAALAGWAARMQPDADVPLIDGVDAALHAAWEAAGASGHPTAPAIAARAPAAGTTPTASADAGPGWPAWWPR